MWTWLGEGCAVVVLWACVAPAQTSSAGSPGDAPKTGTVAQSTHKTSHPAAKTRSKSTTSTSTHNSKSKYASSRKNGKRRNARGQQKIDSERAQQIQEALIREHYLNGEAAGTWNQASEDAMRRYQADHGWQSKTVPDARALISLGLGPSQDHLLNPESAMTTSAAPRAAALTPASHSADPGPHLSPNPAPATAPPPASTTDRNTASPQ